MDLGLSSMQVDQPERGFSYSRQWRRSTCAWTRAARARQPTWSPRPPRRELAEIIRTYGEERYARQIARAIVRRRAGAHRHHRRAGRSGPLAVPTPALFAGGHPAKRVFQALRIAVNDELGNLETGLEAAFDLLAPRGRMAVIAFHSLEDRRVKAFMRARSQGCICPPDLPVCGCGRVAEAALLAPKALMPKQAELDRNPRARSARLRALQRAEGGA